MISVAVLDLGNRQSRVFEMAVALCGVSAFAQEPSQAVTSDQIRAGAELYATNCSHCHGVRLDGTEMAFDLRKFPPGQRERFVASVTRGKNQMPPTSAASAASASPR